MDARHAPVLRARPGAPAATTTTSSRSAPCTRGPRTTCCRCRTTRSCTARARSLAKMPGDRWQQLANLRHAARRTSGRRPARSCCSWAASSASGASGTTRAASTGISRRSPRTPASSVWVGDLNRALRTEPALHERDCGSRPASVGPSPTTATTASSRSCATRRDGSPLLFVANFTPVVRRHQYRHPSAGRWVLARGRQQRRAITYGGSASATSAASTRYRRRCGSTTGR